MLTEEEYILALVRPNKIFILACLEIAINYKIFTQETSYFNLKVSSGALVAVCW